MTEDNLPTLEDETVYDIVGTRQESPDFPTQEDERFAEAEDESGFMEARVDAQGVGNLLSDQIYQDADTIFTREYLANAETACIKAAKIELLKVGYDPEWFTVDGLPRPTREIFDAASEDANYEPVVEVEWHRDDRKFIIQDNGIGMTHDTFINVFLYTARSGVHGDTEGTGKFGIGSMSVQKGLGNGRMVAKMRSRKNDDELEVYGSPLSGYKRLSTEDVMPDGQYGVRFEVPITEKIGRFDAYSNVENYAEKLRVPVVYTEYSGGEEIDNEEFGGFDLVEDTNYVAKVERPGEFTLLIGPKCGVEGSSGYSRKRNNKVMLHSFEIGHNMNSSSGSMYPWTLRIENEHGLIVEGEHKGQTTEEVDHLAEDDVAMPTPTASRDDLSKNNQGRFHEYLSHVANEKCKEVAGQRIEDLETYQDVVDFIQSDKDSYELVWKTLSQTTTYSNRVETVRDDCKNELEKDSWPDIPEEARDGIAITYDWITQAYKGKINKSRRETKRLYEAIAHCEGEMYVGKTINADKVEMVLHNKPGSIIVAADEKITRGNRTRRTKDLMYRSTYEPFEKLGFEKLKNVPTIKQAQKDDDWDVPPNLANKQTKRNKSQSKSTSVEKKSLKIHTSHQANKFSTDDRKAERALEKYDDSARRQLVLFGDSERNLSNNRWVGHLADFTNAKSKKLRRYLLQAENIVTIDQFIKNARDQKLHTPERTLTAGEAVDREMNLVTLVVENEEQREDYNTSGVRHLVLQELRNYYYTESGGILFNVATEDELLKLAPIGESTYMVEVRATGATTRVNNQRRLEERPLMYPIRSTTPRWDNEHSIFNTMDQILSSCNSYRENGEEVVKMIAGLHDLGLSTDDLDRESVQELCE